MKLQWNLFSLETLYLEYRKGRVVRQCGDNA